MKCFHREKIVKVKMMMRSNEQTQKEPYRLLNRTVSASNFMSQLPSVIRWIYIELRAVSFIKRYMSGDVLPQSF